MKSFLMVALFVAAALAAPTEDARDKRGLLLGAPAVVSSSVIAAPALTTSIIAAPAAVAPRIVAAPAAVAIAPQLVAAPATVAVAPRLIATSAIASAPIIAGSPLISSGIIAH